MKIYTPEEIQELWIKILGIQKGTLVLPTQDFIKRNPYMYFPKLGNGPFPNKIKVPTSKFVGIIEGEDSRRNLFRVRWIAEKEDSQELPYFWEREDFTIIGFRK